MFAWKERKSVHASNLIFVLFRCNNLVTTVMYNEEIVFLAFLLCFPLVALSLKWAFLSCDTTEGFLYVYASVKNCSSQLFLKGQLFLLRSRETSEEISCTVVFLSTSMSSYTCFCFSAQIPNYLVLLANMSVDFATKIVIDMAVFGHQSVIHLVINYNHDALAFRTQWW